jgi:hypothetical protein
MKRINLFIKRVALKYLFDGKKPMLTIDPNRVKMLQNCVVLTDADILSNMADYKLESARQELLGMAKEYIIQEEETQRHSRARFFRFRLYVLERSSKHEKSYAAS